MNDELGAVVSEHRDHLKQISGSIRSELKNLSVFVVSACQGMLNGMDDVDIADAMLVG
jgi:hypothetical protein